MIKNILGVIGSLIYLGLFIDGFAVLMLIARPLIWAFNVNLFIAIPVIVIIAFLYATAGVLLWIGLAERFMDW